MQVLALAAEGTHDVVKAELRSLGFAIQRTERDGHWLDLNWKDLARALVHLRAAPRVLLYIGQFQANDSDGVYNGARRIDWGEWLDKQSTFAITVSGDLVPTPPPEPGKPRVRGLDTHIFVSQRIKDAIADDLLRRWGQRPNVDRFNPVMRIVVRGNKGMWSVFLDPCDPALHARGYRVAQTEAPLKETLAAAVVSLSGWPRNCSLVDPMVGSGTLLIEAANHALGIAPGCTRLFAIERWPQHGKALTKMLDEFRGAAVDHAKSVLSKNHDFQLTGYDIDGQVVRAARQNIAEAGLESMIRVEYGDVRELPMQPQGTWLLTNPPYGERLGGEDVTTLYREMGQGLRHKNLHRLAILSGHPDFAEQFGWPVTRTSHLRNGKLEVQLLTFAGDAV
jgi:23S rRNA G2445 N2-methylase RlmL